MRRIALTFLAFTLGWSPALAKVWFVGPGGDFAQIQPAIDAAQEGDVILVRPGAYDRFTLNKGVMVRASATSFSVNTSAYVEPVRVIGIAAGRKAGIGGMRIVGSWLEHPRLEIASSPGEILLVDTYITPPEYPSGYTGWGDGNYMTITDCANVSITALDLGTPGYHRPNTGGQAAVIITGSSVRIAQSMIRGLIGFPGADDILFGFPGEGCTAIRADLSFLVLARTSCIGGPGGDASFEGDGYPIPKGGNGGHGVSAFSSTCVVLGTENDLISGGDGGDGAQSWPGVWWGDGGRGGSGLLVEHALVSRVTLDAGVGGKGEHNGGNGTKASGDIRYDHGLPFLEMAGDVRPGGTLSLLCDGLVPGKVLLFLAGHGGFQTLASAIGPPLSALPGQWFLVVGLGRLTGSAPITVTVPLPDDPAIQGITINGQPIELDDFGAIRLGNAVTRIGGE